MKENHVYEITKEDLIPMAEKYFQERRRLVIMNGYIDLDGNNVVAYNFDFDGDIRTYLLKGESEVPSLTPIYAGSAQWCEEEICEMMNMNFLGLQKSGRLFLPDDFDGTGQILVIPLNELKEKNNPNMKGE